MAKPLAEKIVDAMREFCRTLESDEPIKVEYLERHETPDGPMHLRRKVVLHKGNGKGPAETE